MIEELLEDIKKLMNEMVQANWPAQRLSYIILKYEDKLKAKKIHHTKNGLKVIINGKIVNDYN